MNVVLQNALLIHPGNKFHNQRIDIRIEDHVITAIGNTISTEGAEVITSPNLHVAPGFFDLHVRACDPGLEHKEDLTTVANAAAAGGFTGVALSPKTEPVIDSKSLIQYITKQVKNNPIDFHPVGAMSEGLKGENISEMYDMHLNGAVAFTDEKIGIQNADLLRRALLYTKNFNGLILSFPNDESISHGGKMNEGKVSTMLGLKGIPALAEEVMVSRDLFIAEYCEARIHFSTISTAKSVELIRAAKQKGMQVTCDVAVHNLVFTDEELTEFDTNFKTNPPLRTQADVDALIEGIKDGTIDAITSDHCPENIENKACEFDHADFGISSLETTAALLFEHLTGKLSLDQIVNCLAVNPRKLLGLTPVTIEEGAAANLVYFDPNVNWTPEKKTWNSKSLNNPMIGKTLKGKVLGIVKG